MKKWRILWVRTSFLDENTIGFNPLLNLSLLTSVLNEKQFIVFYPVLILYQKRQNQILSNIYFHDWWMKYPFKGYVLFGGACLTIITYLYNSSKYHCNQGSNILLLLLLLVLVDTFFFQFLISIFCNFPSCCPKLISFQLNSIANSLHRGVYLPYHTLKEWGLASVLDMVLFHSKPYANSVF